MAMMLDSGGGETYARRRSPLEDPAAPPPVAVPPPTAVSRPNIGGTAVPRGTTPPPARSRRRPGDPAPPGTPPPADPPPAVPPPQYRIQPVDQARFDDPSYHSGKYDFLRIGQKYDPTKGITAEMLAELNALGYADFSGSADKLSLRNVRGGGILPYDFNGDFIQNYGTPDAQWAWDWYEPGGGAGATTGASGQGNGFDFDALLRGLYAGQQPQQAPAQAGVDPAALQAILAQLTALQSQQPQNAPQYAAPQTQAPAMSLAPATAGGQASIQTQAVGGGAAPLGADPFMAWLRGQQGGQ